MLLLDTCIVYDCHHHRDPFDRLLIAQANVENLRLVTYDGVFSEYRADTWIARGG